MENQSPSPEFVSALKPVETLWKLLLLVSVILVAGTALFRLDFLTATLLGCAIVGLNFYWTRRVVLGVFLKENAKRRMLLIYVIKFGISAVILFMAVVRFQLPALGLLLGLSNIVIAVIIYSILNVFRPQRAMQ